MAIMIILTIFLLLVSNTTCHPLSSAGAKGNDDKLMNGKVTLDDIFISVKTSSKFHKSRLPAILDTWVSVASNSTWIFTDAQIEDQLIPISSEQFVQTDCPSDHSREALCCKMQAELSTFLRSDRTWFCHVDDDNYLNIPSLVKLLSMYSGSEEELYIGKASIASPLEIAELNTSFLFATGGAGFCLSKSVVKRMDQLEYLQEFVDIGSSIGLPDDVTVGYLVDGLLGVPLTQEKSLHSHLESLKDIQKESLKDQITLSYSLTEDSEDNVVGLEDLNLNLDPTTFYRIHCLLYPDQAKNCHWFRS